LGEPEFAPARLLQRRSMAKATHPSQLSGYARADLGLARDRVRLCLNYNHAIRLRIAQRLSRRFGQDSADSG